MQDTIKTLQQSILELSKHPAIHFKEVTQLLEDTKTELFILENPDFHFLNEIKRLKSENKKLKNRIKRLETSI